MPTPVYTNRFAKDLKLILKQERDPKSLKTVMGDLIEERPLGHKYQNHLLIGNFKDRRECHINPDWLLIRRIDATGSYLNEREPIPTCSGR
jgi:mRNA interferase YafQ